MEIAAGVSVAVLVGFDVAPVAIQTARRKIMQRIAVGSFQNGKLAPMNVAGDEDDSVGFGLGDQIDHLHQFDWKVGP